MSGDCGHGWGYHYQGTNGPCSKCQERVERVGKIMRLADRYALELQALGKKADSTCVEDHRQTLLKAIDQEVR